MSKKPNKEKKVKDTTASKGNFKDKIKNISKKIAGCCAALFGRIKRLNWGKLKTKKGLGVIAGVVALGALATYLILRPTPVYIEGSVSTPQVSSVYGDTIYPNSVSVTFPSPVMNMEVVYKDITEGIGIFPNVAGRFNVSNQYGVIFYPESDWAPDTTYTIKIDKKILDNNVDVKPLEYKFTTINFTGSVSAMELYEDPTNPKIKQITATLNFTHPVDVESVKENLKLKTVSGKKYGFTVKSENADRTIYIVSDPIKITAEEDYMVLSVSDIKNKYNNVKLAYEINEKILIPSSSTFFRLSNVFSDIVLNTEKNDVAEQILFVEFSSAVSSTNLAKYLDVYSYKKGCAKLEEELSRFNNYTDVSGLKPLALTALPSDAKFSKLHSFKYDIISPDNVCLLTVVKQGLLSADDFSFNRTEARTASASQFPSSTKIGFEGSIVSMSGDKKLSIVTRGINKLEVVVSRIPSSAVNHLISQTYGAFGDPNFRGYFDEDNIAENFKETLKLNVGHPADVNYASVDLGKYFQTRKGIFIAEVKGFRKDNIYSTSSDRRLILVSNMGMIVKDNLDKSHEVYVSDFAHGNPVSGAKVEVLGKNGVSVLSATTDSKGHVSFPNLKDFTREKEPVAYIVSYENDFAYMPIDRSDRTLDYSRFDIEGVYEGSDDESIKAFAFSDRGIYRPGEDAYFGLIVRNNNLKTPKGNTIKIEINNPNGDEVLEKTMQVSGEGLMDFKYEVNKMAKTGSYYVNISVLKNNDYYTSIGSTYFTVEEFTPDTMKIKSKIVDAPLNGWLTVDKVEANVTLENLYGNPATDHEIRANFNMNPTTFYFSKYSDYTFTDPLRKADVSYSSISESLDSVQSDEKGEANFEIDLSAYTKGTYRLMFYTQGMEKEGGRSVDTQSSVLISPLPHLVGYKADGDLGYIKKDALRNVEFIAINPTLEQIDLSGLKLEVYEKEYVSTLVKQPNGTYKYQSVAKEKLLSSNKASITRSGLKQALDTSKPGEFFVQIVDGKGEVWARASYMVAGAKNLTYSLDRNAELKMKLDKGQYNHGEDISMQITAPYTGYGLITIEKDKVYAAKWFKADTLASTQSIELPSDVEGNAYINVAFIRDLNSAEIFMSPLSYAVEPFDINKEKRTVTIDLETPTTVKPGEVLKVNYKANTNGKIILYGVNEGILQFSKYQTPKPLTFFLPKKALRVITAQIMDLILPDAGIVNKLRSTGGDEMDEDALAQFANPFARKVDKPVAFWSGVLDVSEDVQTYTYEVPENFNGQIRVMAVSVDSKAFGVTQKSVFVRGDFAMTLSAPFNIIPNDTFEASVSLTNMVEGSKNLKVNLEVIASDNLEIVGDKPTSFDLKERGETSFKTKVKAKETLGDATITFVATSGEYKSKMTIHLGIRPALPYATNIEAGMAKKDKEFKNFTINMYKEYENKEIYASTSPMVLAQGLVKYLDKYPYTCTEQTISRVFPMIVLLFEQPHMVEGVDVYKAYDEAIARLKLRQGSDGGFSYWGNNDSDEFVSIYALQFLQYAKTKGFDVPYNMLTKATDYAKQVAGRDPSSLENADEIAYAIYVLTNGGEVTTNYLINLETNLVNNHPKEWKKSLAANYMAASYKLLKDDDKADALVGYYKAGESEWDDYRHIYLMASHFEGEFNKIKDKSVDVLLEPLKRNTMSSLSSSFSILALSSYPHDKSADESIKFSIGEAGAKNGFAHANLNGVDAKSVLKVSAGKPFYYVLNQQGFGKDLPTSTRDDGVEVVKEILNKDGSTIKSAKLGEEVTVRIRVKSTKKDYLENVAVVDLTPGCFETIGNSLEVSQGYLDSSEVREDRVIMYLSTGKDMKEISYKAKVIAKGEFILPPAFATALYDAEVKANTKGGKFEVVE